MRSPAAAIIKPGSTNCVSIKWSAAAAKGIGGYVNAFEYRTGVRIV